MKQDFQSTPNTYHLDFKIKWCFPQDTASEDLDVGTCSFGESPRSQPVTLQQTWPWTPADRGTVLRPPLPALPSLGGHGWAVEHPSGHSRAGQEARGWSLWLFPVQRPQTAVRSLGVHPSNCPSCPRSSRALPGPWVLVTNTATRSETPQG